MILAHVNTAHDWRYFENDEIDFLKDSDDNRPVPTDSNSRAYLGRDSDRDPNKRDYFYFYVWGQKSRDY